MSTPKNLGQHFAISFLYVKLHAYVNFSGNDKFNSFIEDENLKDFEEDVLGEKAPNTADAMKRYKAGKAGFTDKAHLKAKGLIARSDGTKKKSDKYK